MANRAADVNPGTEHDILHERRVAEPKYLAGMYEILLRIKRVAFADVREIGVAQRMIDREGRDAKRSAFGQRIETGGRPFGGRHCNGIVCDRGTRLVMLHP